MRLQWILFATAMVALASPAGAQITCNTMGNYTTCDEGVKSHFSMSDVYGAARAGLEPVPNSYLAGEIEAARLAQIQAQTRAIEAQTRAVQQQQAAAQADSRAEQTEQRRQAAEIARQENVRRAAELAISNDNGGPRPAPQEQPVMLHCNVGSSSVSLALYEKNGRVDVTEAGATKTRFATFTPDAVSWRGSVWATSVSRTDMSINSTAFLPEMMGARESGTCSTGKRQF